MNCHNIASLNQFKRADRAKKNWRKIVCMRRHGCSILDISKAWLTSSETIQRILYEHDQKKYTIKKSVCLSNDQIAFRIAACRRHDVIAWQCNDCHEVYDGRVMPFSCNCGSVLFSQIAIPQRMDIGRLDDIDNTVQPKQSRGERKANIIIQEYQPQHRKLRIDSIIDIDLLLARGLGI